MSHSKTNAAAFLSLTTLVVLASATALAASWPLALAAAHTEAGNLIGEGNMAKHPAEAIADYQLATWLDPANPQARIGLAAVDIRTGRPEAALAALKYTGAQAEAINLRIRTLIELGRAKEAADQSGLLADPGRTDEDILLTAFAYALSDRSADITALIPRLSSPEAVQRVARVQTGKLPLAAELYAAGLPESSSAILVALPTSFERNVLLGHINYNRHTPASLAAASDYFTEAVVLDPSDVSARRLYAAVLADSGQAEASSKQTDLIKRLENQQP